MRNISLLVLLCVLHHIAGQDSGSGDDVDIVDGSGDSDLDLSEASGDNEVVVEHSVSYSMSSQNGDFSIR